MMAITVRRAVFVSILAGGCALLATSTIAVATLLERLALQQDVRNGTAVRAVTEARFEALIEQHEAAKSFIAEMVPKACK